MMADWREAGAYPRAGASLHRIAWEFLRRNSDYQADWQRFAALGQPNDDDAEIRQSRAANAIARRWGLSWPADPATDTLPGWEHSAATVKMPGPGADHLTATGRARTGKLALTFDLAMPLAPQIDSATNYLRRANARWRRNNPERARAAARAGKANAAAFAEMLRILDGDADNATPAALIAALWPSEDNTYPDYPLGKRLRTRRRSALAYLARKYRELPTLATWTSLDKRKIKASA